MEFHVNMVSIVYWAHSTNINFNSESTKNMFIHDKENSHKKGKIGILVWMGLAAAADIFNMFESTERERSPWAILRDIAVYLPSNPPIFSRQIIFSWIKKF